MNTLILGATGFCGGYLVKYAVAAPQVNKIFTITRRPLKVNDSKLVAIENTDNDKWASEVSKIDSNIDIVLTALATTKATAGSTEAQYKIDHDLNMDLIKAAKEKGCKTVVLISSLGASVNSRIFYTRMKGEIERDITELGFEKVIILRPGVLLGNREVAHNGAGNGTFSTLGNWMYRSKLQSLVGYPVKAEEVSQVGVHLALDPKNTQKVRIVESKEILDIAATLNKK